MEVFVYVGAAQPRGLRDEDRPRLPDGSLPEGRIANTASLASTGVRQYNRAYCRDLLTAYPQVTGVRIDWPEYPCYAPDEVFQDFSPHVETWAGEHGFDFKQIRQTVEAFSHLPAIGTDDRRVDRRECLSALVGAISRLGRLAQAETVTEQRSAPRLARKPLSSSAAPIGNFKPGPSCRRSPN